VSGTLYVVSSLLKDFPDPITHIIPANIHSELQFNQTVLVPMSDLDGSCDISYGYLTFSQHKVS
jgi:hypothetical protein